MFSILAGIVALSLLIIIHEFGHFVAAKLAGMHVDRFSVFGIGAPICRLGTYMGTE
jgi:regulator of sigma E protease